MSSKRLFAGRLWAGLEYLASLFTGTGSVPAAATPDLVVVVPAAARAVVVPPAPRAFVVPPEAAR